MLKKTAVISYGSVPAEDDDDAIVLPSIRVRASLSEPRRQQTYVAEEVSPTLYDFAVCSNTCNALLGVSIFTIPWAFTQAGLIGGGVVLVMVSTISFETAKAVLQAQRKLFILHGRVFSYPEIAASIFETNVLSQVVQAATIISCLGGNVGYMIFLGQMLSQLLKMRYPLCIVLLTLPMVLMSWIRSFQELFIFTVFGVIAIVVSIFAIIFDGLRQSTESYHDSSSAYASELQYVADGVPLLEPGTIFNMVGPATFLFTIHYCILSMGSESLVREQQQQSALSSPARAGADDKYREGGGGEMTFVRSVRLAYVLSTSLIGLLGALAFLLYRKTPAVYSSGGDIESGCEDIVCQNVILNITQGTRLKLVVEVSLVIAICLSYVVILIPAREHVERFALSHMCACRQGMAGMLLKNAIRAALVIATSVVAIISPYFGAVLGAIGGLTDTLQSFVLPSLIYLLTRDKATSGTLRPTLFRIVCCWGVLTILTTLARITTFVYFSYTF